MAQSNRPTILEKTECKGHHKPQTSVVGADRPLTQSHFSLWPAAGVVRRGFVGPRLRMKTAKDASKTKASLAWTARMVGCHGHLAVRSQQSRWPDPTARPNGWMCWGHKNVGTSELQPHLEQTAPSNHSPKPGLPQLFLSIGILFKCRC